MNWRVLPPLFALLVSLSAQETLPATKPIGTVVSPEDRSTEMVAGIARWLHREDERVTADRHRLWEAAAKGPAWETFAAEKRKDLASVLGIEAKRATPMLEKMEGNRVRWAVFEGVYGEGIYLPGNDDSFPTAIVVPDAGEMPEECLIARRLATMHFPVLVLTTLNRADDFSGNAAVRFTNETHREWIYRQAFEVGRSGIGYEVQKVLAAADALKTRVIVAGHGEGSGIALRAAALDHRLEHVILQGSFEPHTAYEKEPIDRNLYASRLNFGDAELAALAHGLVLVELEAAPKDFGPLPPREGRAPEAAPVTVTPASPEAVRAEIATAKRYCDRVYLTEDAVASLCEPKSDIEMPPLPKPMPVRAALPVDADYARERQRRTVRELEQHTQHVVIEAERARNEQVWAKIGTPEWPAARAALQERLWASIGKLPGDRLPPNPRTRQVMETNKWTAYEVMLDVVPDVFAWGWLLVPKDLQPGERRPVVVCQHGLEGLPGDCVTLDEKSKAYGFYKGFAAKLADQGYITYAPHNPYRGHDAFRELQRQANPLGLSLFSFIIAQHQVTTDWLAGLPFVDPQRIGFYGLSYGGKTAMRVPALVDRYALSICSGDFNEWIRKCVSVEERNSFMFTGEYEMFEWNLAWNANYAEMAMLIAPRPFMVERGHKDGVAIDELVGYEYAKVLRGYQRLGIPNLTSIEWFDGPHTINGVGTFEFLPQHLGSPRR